MDIPQSVRELVENGPLAHLATINSDGRPQVSVIWIGIDGPDIVSGHMTESLKVRNVRRLGAARPAGQGVRRPGLHLPGAGEPGRVRPAVLDRAGGRRRPVGGS